MKTEADCRPESGVGLAIFIELSIPISRKMFRCILIANALDTADSQSFIRARHANSGLDGQARPAKGAGLILRFIAPMPPA